MKRQARTKRCARLWWRSMKQRSFEIIVKSVVPEIFSSVTSVCLWYNFHYEERRVAIHSLGQFVSQSSFSVSGERTSSRQSAVFVVVLDVCLPRKVPTVRRRRPSGKGENLCVDLLSLAYAHCCVVGLWNIVKLVVIVVYYVLRKVTFAKVAFRCATVFKCISGKMHS